jgi:hypothetical protein
MKREATKKTFACRPTPLVFSLFFPLLSADAHVYATLTSKTVAAQEEQHQVVSLASHLPPLPPRSNARRRPRGEEEEEEEGEIP